MRALGVCVALAAVIGLAACGSSGASPTPTPVPLASGTSGGAAAGVSGGGSPAPSSLASPSSEPTPDVTPPVSPSTSPSPSDAAGPPGPYTVDETIGDSHITGAVCSVARPFTLTVAASRVTFQMAFTPQDEASGAVDYAYSLPDAGESDTATGTYAIRAPDGQGVRPLVVSVRDHSVFKGFDGYLPIRETLHLTPDPHPSCP